MDSRFFERPILNSPYAYPARHWELDAQGQPTGDIIEARRTAQFITPVPRPKKHKRSAGQERLASAPSSPELMRLALRPATGAGKTMVARAGGTPPALSA